MSSSSSLDRFSNHNQTPNNHHETISQQQPRSLLLALPAELRNRIYTYTLSNPKLRLELSPTHSTNEWLSPPLSRASRQLRSETLALWYSSHSFIYEIPSHLPLDIGIAPLRRVLVALRQAGQGIRLGSLSFLHVNSGVASMRELAEWVGLFVLFRNQMPERVGMVYWPLRRNSFALAAAKGLCDLGNVFAKEVRMGDFADGSADGFGDGGLVRVVGVDVCDGEDDVDVREVMSGEKGGDAKLVGGVEGRIREFLDAEVTRKILMEGLRGRRGYHGRDAGVLLGWADEL